MRIQVESLERSVAEMEQKGRFAHFKDPDKLCITDIPTIKTFLRNPYLRSMSQTAQFIGVSEDTIIGGISTMPMRIIVDNRESFESAANPGMFVNEHYRKSGYALDLLDAMPKSSCDGLAVNYYVSKMARQVIGMFGGAVFSISQFTIVRRSSLFFARRFPSCMSKLVCCLLDLIFLAHRILCSIIIRMRTYNWVLERVLDDSSIEEFSSHVAEDHHKFREDVSPTFMNWILNNDFESVQKADKSIWRIKKKNATIGFVMTRLSDNGQRGRILEWQAVHGYEKEVPWMLLCVSRVLVKKCSAVVLSVSSEDLAIVKVLRRLLPRLPTQAATVSITDGSRFAKCAGWREQSNWRLRPIMGDCGFY